MISHSLSRIDERGMPYRAILSVLGMMTFFVPLSSFAQSELCPSLTRTLIVGTRGEDVRQLQQFLISKGELPSGYATGYFGTFTEQGVGMWQESNRIIFSRSDPGYGIVGPKTRAAIIARCTQSTGESPRSVVIGPVISSTQSGGSGASFNSVTKCSGNQIPKTACTTFWQGRLSSGGCITSWYCTAVATRYLTSASSTIVAASSTLSATSSSSTSTSTNTNTSSSFNYWCPNGIGDFGYWSATPCPVSDISGTYGSSANVQEGALCAPEGRQEFVACPYMANCPNGGTYLICEGAIWNRF